MKNSDVTFAIDFNKTKDKRNGEYQLDNPSWLPDLKGKVKIDKDGNTDSYEINIAEGSQSISQFIKADTIISATVNSQTIILNLSEEDNLAIETGEDNGDNAANENSALKTNKTKESCNTDKNVSQKTNTSEENDNSTVNQENKNDNMNLDNVKKNIISSNSFKSKYDNSELENLDNQNRLNKSDSFNNHSDKEESEVNYGLLIIPIALVLFILFALKRRKDEEDEN